MDRRRTHAQKWLVSGLCCVVFKNKTRFCREWNPLIKWHQQHLNERILQQKQQGPKSQRSASLVGTSKDSKNARIEKKHKEKLNRLTGNSADQLSRFWEISCWGSLRITQSEMNKKCGIFIFYFLSYRTCQLTVKFEGFNTRAQTTPWKQGLPFPI